MRAAKFLAGAMFCVTAAFLHAVNHLAAAIYAPGLSGWETRLGKVGQAHKEVGYGLEVWAVIFLVVGVVFMRSSASDAKGNDL